MNAPLRTHRDMLRAFRERNGPMIRLSLPYLIEQFEQMEPLSRLPDGGTPDKPVTYGEVSFPLFMAQWALEQLTNSSLYRPYLRTSWQLSQQLLAAIRAQTANTTDYTRQLTPFELYGIKNNYQQYKTALLAELGAFNVYFVTQQGGYDMYTLLQSGESLFPADLRTKVPEALIDAREAAKALAYEVPTACGFHTFRVMESVLRRYHTHVTGGKAPPKVRNIGVYLNSMRQAKKGDEKVLGALKQMADLHRNPLIHPEVVLTEDEAIATLGMAISVITAMLSVLPVLPTTTATAVAAVAASPSGP
jgi:hypothetical protein